MNNILVQAPRLLNKHKKCKRFITSYQTKIRKEVFIMSIKLYNINEEYREKFYQIPKVFLQILNISSYPTMQKWHGVFLEIV